MKHNVGILGMGYVGFALAEALVNSRHHVLGYDTNQRKIDLLNSGISTVDDISDEQLSKIYELGLELTVDAQNLHSCEVYVVCVPTPLGIDGGPNLSFLNGAIETVGSLLKKGDLVCLESTTYPGTTEFVVKPLLEAISGLKAGIDFSLVFSPERIDPGNENYRVKNTPKIVGGVSKACTARGRDFYSTFVDLVVTVPSSGEAEMAKLLENTYRQVNIALINELAIVAFELGVDIWEVINAAKTKPYGFEAFYPGPGPGGHCIPIDPEYLNYAYKMQSSSEIKMIHAATQVNKQMPGYIVERTINILSRIKKEKLTKRILVIGLTYKENISDIRESPSISVIELLKNKGFEVYAWDPNIMGNENLEVQILNNEGVSSLDFDVAIILQKHKEIKEIITSIRSQSILDCRNALVKNDKTLVEKL